MSSRPNVILFITDDQRFDTIHALGNTEIQTPNLDALVNRGTAFTRAYIPGGTYGAVCMPSRAMLYTGRTLFHLKGEGQEIPDAHTTIGEYFQSAGYTAYGIGKWHNGKNGFARSFSNGNEIFFGGMGDHWNVPVYRFDPAGKYSPQIPYTADPLHSNKTEYLDGDHITAGKHSTDLFVDAAVHFIETKESLQPFFMNVALMAPHDPRTMPDKFRKMYNPKMIKLPENFSPQHTLDTGSLQGRDELLAAFPRNPSEIKTHIAEYYGMISHLDEAFGRLTTALEKKGELENTIIVFAADHGLALGQHGLMGKQNLYDHSIRVPLVFAGPGIPKGQTRNSLVYLLDIFPTLCDLTQGSVPGSSEGKSLVPLLNHSESSSRHELYLAFKNSIRGFTDGTYKLIEYSSGDTQLFNLLKDPLEIENLLAANGANDILLNLRRKLRLFSEAWEDEKHPAGRSFWAKRQDLKKF